VHAQDLNGTVSRVGTSRRVGSEGEGRGGAARRDGTGIAPTSVICTCPQRNHTSCWQAAAQELASAAGASTCPFAPVSLVRQKPR
jgi:hypothetical protein